MRALMSAREVILLGTASQVPTRARNHNALFLRWDTLGILFDPGEGTQRQMLLAGLAATQITHICITHFHGDHCLGLAALVQRLSLDKVPHPVEVIFPRSGQVYFERLRYSAIYHEQATIVPRPIHVQRDPVKAEAEGEIVVAERGDVRIVARPLDHRVDCLGYRVEERDGRRMLPEKLAAAGLRGTQIRDLIAQGQLEVDGKLVHLDDVSEYRPGQSFALTMDTRPCPGARRLAEGADLLVSEATFLNSEATEANEYRHMTAAQAATLAKDAGVRRLVLTHFSQRYTSLEGFVAEAGAIHPEVVVARDLTVVPVPARR